MLLLSVVVALLVLCLAAIAYGYFKADDSRFEKPNYAQTSANISKTKNKNHVYNNYGFAGANSIFGLALTERFLREDLPDIVFVEYALNDASDNESRNAFEGLIRKLLEAYKNDSITIRTESKDYDSWYNKRTAVDGKVDFKGRTRDIYNLIRGVAHPFPGAFAFVNSEDGAKITVWNAQPFDEMMDFSGFAPGEVVDIFDGKLDKTLTNFVKSSSLNIPPLVTIPI